MKNKNNTGFLKDMQKAKTLPANKKEGFAWSKPVVKPEECKQMGVMRRLNENKSAAKSNTNLVDEQTKFVANRRAVK